MVCGTPGYMPPEALKGRGYHEKSDVFSAGSIMFNLLTKNFLFNVVEDPVVIMEANKNCDNLRANVRESLLKKAISLNAIDLICGLINSDPTKRLSAE